MSDRQVRDEAMTLFLAGHETTAKVLAWSIYLLARHSKVGRAYEHLLRFDPDRSTQEPEAPAATPSVLAIRCLRIGNRFALMDAQLALAIWLQRVRIELLDRRCL